MRMTGVTFCRAAGFAAGVVVCLLFGVCMRMVHLTWIAPGHPLPDDHCLTTPLPNTPLRKGREPSPSFGRRREWRFCEALLGSLFAGNAGSLQFGPMEDG